jgi:hypothetical protein
MITPRLLSCLRRLWTIPLGVLAPGIYRADVLLGKTVEWRAFFRVRQ